MSETNVVKGYKVFGQDWTCRGKQYKVGETATQDGKLKFCRNGIHFCTKIEDCFRYYPIDLEYKMAEVEAIGDVLYSHEDSTCCTNKLRIVRKVSILKLLDNEEYKKAEQKHISSISVVTARLVKALNKKTGINEKN